VVTLREAGRVVDAAVRNYANGHEDCARLKLAADALKLVPRKKIARLVTSPATERGAA
jgi:hypothetical protein